MKIFVLDESIEVTRGVRLLIDSKNHLSIHVFKIRPEGIQRNIVLFVFHDYCLNLCKTAIAPSALVMPKTPKGRNVPSPNKIVVFLQNFLGVLLTEEDKEMERAANRVIDELVRVLIRLH